MQICSQCSQQNQDNATFCNRCGSHLRGIRDPLVDRLIHKYQIKERIGGGGFGSVYRAEHIDLLKSVAIKILHPHLVHNELMVERFRREAQLLASLRHPNIVEVIDFGEMDSLGLYLVMEWLEGNTLQWHIKHEGQPPPETLQQIFEQLLDALGYAHQHGIVHRDLKPENFIWVPVPGPRNRRTLKVLDFGIARILEKGKSGARLTETGLAVGTPRYMSPEQAAGEIDRIDHRTDLYACGILLVEMLTGRPIFSGTTNEILLHQMESPPPSLSDLAPDKHFSPALEWVVQRALAKNPDQRFASAEQFTDALIAALDCNGTQIVKSNELQIPSVIRPIPASRPIITPPAYGPSPHHAPMAKYPTPPLPISTPAPQLSAQISIHAQRPELANDSPILPVNKTRALTPGSVVPPPRTPLTSPHHTSASGGSYRGEKQSGHRESQPQQNAMLAFHSHIANNWIWALIGLVGGVGVALMFFIFSSFGPESPSRNQGTRQTSLPRSHQDALPSLPSNVDALPSLPPPHNDSPRTDGDLHPRSNDSVFSKSEHQPPSDSSHIPHPRTQTATGTEPNSSTSDEPQSKSALPANQTKPPISSDQPGQATSIEPQRKPKTQLRPSKKLRTQRKPTPRINPPAHPEPKPTPKLAPTRHKTELRMISLTIRSKPSGAEVLIDSVTRGKTPLTIRFSEGQSIRVMVKKEGFLSNHFTWTADTKSTIRDVTLAEDIY
jgi:serine/threonine protein kinase